MNKLLILVLVAAAVVLGWLALSRREAPTASTPAGAPSAREVEPGAAADDDDPSTPAARASAAPRPVVGGLPGPSSAPRVVWPAPAPGVVGVSPIAGGQEPGGRAIGGQEPGGGAVPGGRAMAGNPAPAPPQVGGHGPGGPSRYGRPPGEGMATFAPAAVKATLRRYWSNLPKSTGAPARVAAAELLPADLLRQMNIPPESQVTMIGDRRLTDPKAFTDLFARPEDQPSLMGVSVITPDGVEIRDYVRLTP